MKECCEKRKLWFRIAECTGKKFNRTLVRRFDENCNDMRDDIARVVENIFFALLVFIGILKYAYVIRHTILWRGVIHRSITLQDYFSRYF